MNKYGVTTVPLPYSGELPHPSTDGEWELVSTEIYEMSSSENIGAVMPGCSSYNNTNRMMQLVCVWVCKPFKQKTGGGGDW